MDKVPPSSIEAECAVLGAAIIDANVINDIAAVLRGPSDFYMPKHVAIYAAQLAVYEETQSIDMVTLTQKLVDRGEIEQVGGVDYLIDLLNSVPGSSGASHYARIVREKAMVRDILNDSSDLVKRCYAGEPVQDLLVEAGKSLYKLQSDKGITTSHSLTGLMDSLMEHLEENDGKDSTGLSTGFKDIDDKTGGLHPGEVTILAARPSMGKTALMLNIAEHIAIDLKKPVAVFSMEMSKEQLTQRMMSSRSGVDSQRMRHNCLQRSDFSALQSTFGALKGAPMFIDDTPGLDPVTMRAKAQRLAIEHGIEAIFIDYLQLMNDRGYNARHEEVSAISRHVKAMARDIGVPVVCLSQLNRQAENRDGHKPRMSDLRESGAIEQDADVVAMLHREDYFHRDDPMYEPSNTAELILAKQRNGPVGTIRLQFHGPTTRFHTLAPGF